MSTEKEFKWDDNNVKEFVEQYFHHVDVPFQGYYFKNMAEDFKQSKLQSQDKPQPSSIDRIEVTTCGHANWNEPNGGAFIFKTNKPIRYNDFPSEKIKQAIEAVLNGDTVVEDDIVGLLRDCVSSTWGNPSLDRTQELFDKFLLDRKLVNPTLKDVNKTVTKLVNEILLDKKYSQSEVDTIRRETWHACREWANGMWSNQLFPLGGNSQFKYPFIEDYLKSLSTPTTQPKEEDKRDIIIDQLKTDLKRVKNQRNEYELEVRQLYNRITSICAENKELKAKQTKQQ